MTTKMHWENIYSTKSSEAVSWYQPHAERSLEWIASTGIALDAPIIDVGGGASTLVDSLLDAGYQNITVLDLSGAALRVTQQRLGDWANQVHWCEAGVTTANLPAQKFAVWHDRAVFHFRILSSCYTQLNLMATLLFRRLAWKGQRAAVACPSCSILQKHCRRNWAFGFS